MSNQELRDLLHERVAEETMPDLSGAAWERATRIRRRRAAGAVAATVAAVAVIAVAVGGGGGTDRSTGPGPATQDPSPRPSTTAPATPSVLPGAGDTRPDARYRGWPVYYGPLVPQEETLARVDSPFPRVVDLSAAAPDLADRPITSALAAYALVDDSGATRLLLLAPDGSLRSVDTSRVAPYDDGSGDDISVAHDNVLSPTGEYLAFPQDGSVQVLTLATGKWSTVDTRGAPTTTLHWMGDTDLWLPPTTQGGQGPMYSVLDGTRVGSTGEGAPEGPFGAGAGPYGRWRMGPSGTAQSWTGVTGLPVPDDEITPSQVLLVQGDAPAGNAMLVLSAASMSEDYPRPQTCCGVEFWLDDDTVVYESDASPRRLVAWRVGTHALAWVTQIDGYDPGRELLVSSYARIWDR